MRIIRKRTTVTGTDTTDATASAAEILAGETAYVNGVKVTGELVPLDTSDATAVAEEILAGETAYVNGVKVTGELVPLDTSDATAAAEDILAGEIAYVNGAKVTGTISKTIGGISPSGFVMSIYDYCLYLQQGMTMPTGDLSDLPPYSAATLMPGYIQLYGDTVTGDLSDFPAGTLTYLGLDLPLVTGDMADLPTVTGTLSVAAPLVTGVPPVTATTESIDVLDTNMSGAEIDQLLIALAAVTEVTEGSIVVPTGRTTDSDAAKAALETALWTVQEGSV